MEESDYPPHVALAELYLELGRKPEAYEHASKGYRRAWTDGPPYADWWEFERCRAVLKAVGELEPVLPPFDPDKIEPIPYESEIRALIDKLNAEKRR